MGDFEGAGGTGWTRMSPNFPEASLTLSSSHTLFCQPFC